MGTNPTHRLVQGFWKPSGSKFLNNGFVGLLLVSSIQDGCDLVFRTRSSKLVEYVSVGKVHPFHDSITFTVVCAEGAIFWSRHR